jgi:hypothetical protein
VTERHTGTVIVVVLLVVPVLVLMTCRLPMREP